jgi:hypothetical protein
VVALVGEAEEANGREGEQETKERRQEMSMKEWEKKVLAVPGAPARVAAIEEEQRLAMGLTALESRAASPSGPWPV